MVKEYFVFCLYLALYVTFLQPYSVVTKIVCALAICGGTKISRARASCVLSLSNQPLHLCVNV